MWPAPQHRWPQNWANSATVYLFLVQHLLPCSNLYLNGDLVILYENSSCLPTAHSCQTSLHYIQYAVNTPSQNVLTAIIKLSQLSTSLWQQDDRDTTSTSNEDVCTSVVAINKFHIKWWCIGRRYCLETQHNKQCTNWKWTAYMATTTPQLFYGPFSGTTRLSRCQRRTSGLYGTREDQQRQTHWPSGWVPLHPD